MLKKIIKAGIDTVQIELKGHYDSELQGIGSILEDKTSYTVEDNTRVVLKANKELSDMKEVVACIELITEKIKCESWRVRRMDIAVDYESKLEENLNISRLFLEALSIVRRKENLEVFSTKRGIEKQGNIKIANKRIETTIYNCIDKNRMANMRVENRTKDIRNELEDKENIRKEIKKFLDEINGLENLVGKVEEKYINGLYSFYNETIGEKFRTFSEFVAMADSQGYMMTSNILKGLMKKVGIKTGYKCFVENFKRKRKNVLNFTSKTDLKKMVSEIKKEVKKI